MTVCIAAICSWGAPLVLGASDRMLTAGDVEFEPDQTKVFRLGSHAVALTAGDSTAQFSICLATSAEVRERGISSIADVADVYSRHFAEERRKRAERDFLNPLGLDLNTFIARQHDMTPEAVSRLTRLLTDYEMAASTLIVGVDENGSAHIYRVDDPGQAICYDGIGFAAIGAGQSHAESQFMLAGYTKAWEFPRAFLLTYVAKRRAEVAPGVGTETDMFWIGRERYSAFPQSMVSALGTEYERMSQTEKTALEQACKGVSSLLEVVRAQEQAQVTQGRQGDPLDNQAAIRGGTQESEPSGEASTET